MKLFPLSLRFCITLTIICIFISKGLQLYLRIYRTDYRVEEIGITTKQPFQGGAPGMYLRKIQNKIKMENFELIEMMNETNPNLLSDDAVLVISASHSQVQHSYAHLLEKIESSNKQSERLPFYLLRKAKSLLMQNSKVIKVEVDEIVKVLQYFTDSLLIKRLTILSFQQGSLLSLRSLAFIKYDVFSIIDKMILINPFNPSIMIFHSNAALFLKETKQKILADSVRTQLTNGTRIIIIHTMIDNNFGEGDINWLFNNNKGERVTFANSLVVPSKIMWNVYSYLKPEEYFRFAPFNEIMTKFFNEDRHNGPLSIRDIKYLLLFRELPTPKELGANTKNKILSKCVDYYMQNYNRNGQLFDVQCIRVLRKEDFFFNENTTILIYSIGKFQLLGQNHERISPYEVKGQQTVFLIENVLEFRRFFIVNRKKHKIALLVQPRGRPSLFQLDPYAYDPLQKHSKFSSSLVPAFKYSPVCICPGFTILQPKYLVENVYIHQFLKETNSFVNDELDCYESIDNYIVLIKNILRHWNFGCNLIVFSLFCFHTTKRSTHSRFYTQYLINVSLTFFHKKEILLTENLMILSIIVLIEIFLKLTTWMSSMIYIPKSLAIKVMWIPLAFEMLKWFGINVFISPWKAVGLLFFAGTNKSNIVIIFLQSAYIVDYIIRDTSNIQGLFLSCAWLALSSFEDIQINNTNTHIQTNDLVVISTGRKLQSIKKTIIILRKQIVDTLTVCMMGMCLSQDGIILHYIVDFYITAFVIFAIHSHLEDIS